MVAQNNLFDRSPCSTGTCGRMAILNHESKLFPGKDFVSRSIIGSKFVGKIVRDMTVGKKRVIVPEITGSAYITGISNFVESEEDKLAGGFVLESSHNFQ